MAVAGGVQFLARLSGLVKAAAGVAARIRGLVPFVIQWDG